MRIVQFAHYDARTAANGYARSFRVTRNTIYVRRTLDGYWRRLLPRVAMNFKSDNLAHIGPCHHKSTFNGARDWGQFFLSLNMIKKFALGHKSFALGFLSFAFFSSLLCFRLNCVRWHFLELLPAANSGRFAAFEILVGTRRIGDLQDTRNRLQCFRGEHLLVFPVDNWSESVKPTSDSWEQ